MTHHAIHDAAANVTYSGAVASFAMWGLHISDVGVIVSSLAAVCGVVIQLLILKRTGPAPGAGRGETQSEDGSAGS